MKNHKTTNGIKIALFATFLLLSGINLSAQYKLELEWQKQPGGVGFNISSIVTSSNDSLIYVAGGVYINNKSEFYIHTCKSSDGTVIKTDSVEAPYKMILSKDGKTLVAAGNYGVGLLDPLTFKRVYWNSEKASDYLSLNFNEKQSKFVICGSPTFIWIYNVESKQLFKEIKPKYNLSNNIILRNALLTDDGKYIIYSYVTDVQKFKNYISIMDIEGNIVKEFLETSSTNFTITVDGNTLIYFDNQAMHFFDLRTMKEVEGIPIGGANPENIEMSSDGKFMLAGYGGGLVYYDLENKNSYYLNQLGSWTNFKLNSNNSNLFSGQSRNLNKWKLVPINSNQDFVNKIEFIIQVSDNELILKSNQEMKSDLKLKIISIDGKIVKTILPNEAQIISNGIKLDITILTYGAYLLQISDDQNTLSLLKFIKAN